jgi:hypothetical protein
VNFFWFLFSSIFVQKLKKYLTHIFAKIDSNPKTFLSKWSAQKLLHTLKISLDLNEVTWRIPMDTRISIFIDPAKIFEKLFHLLQILQSFWNYHYDFHKLEICTKKISRIITKYYYHLFFSLVQVQQYKFNILYY